ncbi:hypothetical protein OWM54_39725 [Myxococcus sp. MISCRS1]|uniref:hypothetical protein n=1 Tax=Myxococcus sp. MISCRS1 TaxID=2996786 RepID=UPI00226F0333|nr:hypothetical protein [Myxococcus sp. MISCRS1]MCY1003294.1 hypothetical protein [Myxococcus sp. MISCRS1]
MNWRNARGVLAVTLVTIGIARPVLAQPPSTSCDALHPGYFTYIQERRESLLSETSFDLYEPFGKTDAEPTTDVVSHTLRRFAQLNNLKMPPCLEGNHFLPGRFQVGERSEIVIAFNPSLIKELSGQVGRVDVEGKVITGGVTSREIEIPGYREIGRATPSVTDQFARAEALVADVLLILQMVENMRTTSETYHSELFDTLSAGYSNSKRPLSKKTDSNPSLPAEKQQHQVQVLWALLNLFPNRDAYLASFNNLLANGDALSREEETLDDKAGETLKSILTVAQLGKSILSTHDESIRELREKLARSRATLELDQFNIYFLHFRRWQQLAAGTGERGSARDDVCDSHTRFRAASFEWCTDSRLTAACDLLTRATTRICDGAGPAAPTLAILQAEYEKARPLMAQRSTEYAQELSTLDAPVVQERLRATLKNWRRWESDERAKQEATDLLTLSRTSPHFSSFISALEKIATESKQSGSSSAVLNLLRKNIHSVEMLGFREIRLQPRIIGATAGDVIEITISYVPPGAGPPPPSGTTATTTTTPALANPSAFDGRLRTATWTLRFLVDRTGWYVLAGPRLSMNFSRRYTPEAENLRGTWGTLSLGVGADFTYFPGKEISPELRGVLAVVSGVGIRVDQLDFDERQAAEFGIEGHLLLFRGMLTAGVGFNTAVFPIKSGRPVYFSVGLGFERILDEALRLADQSKR